MQVKLFGCSRRHGAVTSPSLPSPNDRAIYRVTRWRSIKEGTIIGVAHFIYSLTLSFIFPSSASPCPHISPSLGHSASLTLFRSPPPHPTNGLPHCGRNVTTLICVAGRKEGMFNGFFSFYLLREPCYVLMDSAAAAWPSTLPLPHPKVEHQGRTAGHYLRQTSVTLNLFFMVSERRAIHFWGCSSFPGEGVIGKSVWCIRKQMDHY